MLQTVWAIVREGKVELIEKAPLPEGALVLVTLLPQEEESQFWMRASQASPAGMMTAGRYELGDGVVERIEELWASSGPEKG